MKNHALRVFVGFIAVTPFLFGQTKTPSPVEQLQQLTAQARQDGKLAGDREELREK